ncbi:DUF1697 domain-containing protein [uncultured Amnibacterium sp.]|uniref:DUF1697 domain-containing protein n=1 Tax=uncultured Amnibacterium sp. TaxID=1631851 RepID=UPI0035CB381F
MIGIVLLRGVNIGAVRIPMQQLAQALTVSGFDQVRTVLASGNVVVSSDLQDPQAIADEVAAVVRSVFGFDLAVIGVAPDTMQSAVDDYPFPRAGDRHAYVVFAHDRAALNELAQSAGDLDPTVERVQRGGTALNGTVLYWDAPKGQTLATTFGKQYGRRQQSGAVTTRNLNTLEKILAIA